MKYIIFILLFFSFIRADSILLVKKGWQLIGSSTSFDNMDKFESQNVEQVWHFDATTQKWLGFSPDNSIQEKMKKHNIPPLKELKSWHGFWVKSKQDWSLILPDNNYQKKDTNSPKDIIELKKGWNLISLPVDFIVSADIFKGFIVWKYNSNGKWELFDKDNNSKENFPPIKHINNSDALWVKATKDTNLSVVKSSSKLHNFSSKEKMIEYIKEMIVANNRPSYWGVERFYLQEPILVDSTPILGQSGESEERANILTAQDTTHTNLQESDVDESDVLKHNNKYIFNIVSSKPNHINITSFDKLVSSSEKKILNQIYFDNNVTLESLYLVNNRLIVIADYCNWDYKVNSIYSDSGLRSIIDIYDVSDINSIQKVVSYKIDGEIINSRVIGDELYLISSFVPSVNISYPKKYIELSPTCKEYFEFLDTRGYLGEDSKKYAQCFDINRDDNNRYFVYDYDNPDVKVGKLIPQITNDNLKRDLLTPSRLYAPSKQNQMPTITTILNISIPSGRYQNSNSFVGYSTTQYASPKALYLVSNQYPIYYDFYNYKERSKIYKFDLDNELKYKGAGEVLGNTINQFALSEYKDILRVATTQEIFSRDNISQNSIYTLKEENGELKVIGILNGLGKKGETIRSVRFIKDKAFVVTFRQTDPFYTIDISNPAQPKKVGELKINGFSAYLHPIGDDKILGIGRNALEDGELRGLKVELFDISDFANPQSLDTIYLKKAFYSELENNHKAFIYRNSDNLFAFPYTQDEGKSENEYQENKRSNYLGVYQVENNSLKKFTPIKEKVISNSTNNVWGRGHLRGIIFDLKNKTYVSLFNQSDFSVTRELNITE